MDTLRFLQFSDLHFENTEHEWQWACSKEKADIIEQEMRQVVEKIIELTKEREVEVILIPGNLFDAQTVSLDGIRFLQDCFRSLGGIPVFIAPGNEDPYEPSSLYNSQFLREIGMKAWPKNVHVFTEQPYSSVVLSEDKNVVITGIPHVGLRPEQERPLSLPLEKAEGGVNILMFRGTCERDGSSDGQPTMPFSPEELHTHGFDYVAFGHPHIGEEIKDKKGRIRGAASGCPYGRKIDEIGEKTVILGEIATGGIGPENMERIRVAPRTVHDVRVRCGGLKQIRALSQRTEKALHRGNVEPTHLVLVRMEGKSNHELLDRVYEDSVKGMFFLTKMETSEVRSDFDFRKYARGQDTERTTEGVFIQNMKELLDQPGSPSERRIREKALEWGLDALKDRKIEFGYEDQEI